MDTLLPSDLIALAARVIAENKAAGRTVALAESCTGGLVAAALTEIAGSSAVLDRGFVTYSNEAKHEMLACLDDLIDTFGAVSIAVAWAMAQGALKHSTRRCGGGDHRVWPGRMADLNRSRSAPWCSPGPSGGEDPEAVNAELKLFETAKTRAEVRLQAALCALELLLP